MLSSWTRPYHTDGVSSAAATFVDEIVSTARELEHPNTYPTTILDGFQAMVRAAGPRYGVCALIETHSGRIKAFRRLNSCARPTPRR
jgi:hypothetical protein